MNSFDFDCLFNFDQEKHDKITFNEGIEKGIKKGIEKGIEKGIKNTVKILYSMGVSKNIIIEKLQENYELSLSEAEKYINDNLPTVN